MKKLLIPVSILLIMTSCGDEASQQSTTTSSSTEQSAPDVQEGNKIERPAYSLTYPSDWKIDSSDEDFSYDSYFTIDGVGESFISFFILSNAIDPAAAVEEQVKTFSNGVVTNPEVTTFTKWGNIDGNGKLLKGKLGGALSGEVKIFATAKGEKTFLMVEQYFDSDIEKDKPGYDMIENSFTIK